MADAGSEFTSDTDGATGSATPARAQLVGGTDGTNLRGILTDSSGRIIVSDIIGSITAEIDGYLLDGKVFSTTTDFISITGQSETTLALIKNPSGSGKIIKFYSLTIGANSASSRSVFRFYIQPTITSNGTALAISNNYAGHATTTIAQAFHSPVVSSNGSLAGPFVVATDQNSLPILRGFVIPSGVNALATIQNTQNNTPVHINIVWIEI
jgi:hypothetical protein